jgi:hypothetical protein
VKKIKSLSLTTILFISTLFTYGTVAPLLLTSSAAAAGVSCSNSVTFLGLPAWYEYLDVQPNDKNTGCNIKAHGSGNIIVLVLLALIDICLKLSALIAVIFVVYGGFRFTTAQGSPEGVAAGKKTLLNAVIGLVIAVLASQIVKFVAHLLSN